MTTKDNRSGATRPPAGLRIVGEPPPWHDEVPLPEEPDDRKGSAERGRAKQADVLVQLVRGRGVDLWHTREYEAFATLRTGHGLEHVAVRSQMFELWLRGVAYRDTGSAPGGQAFSDAVAQLQAIARFDGAEHEAPLRVAGDDSVIWIAVAPGRVARIDAAGWRVTDACDDLVAPRFRWPSGMLPLPEPQRGGRLRDLQDVLNIPDNAWPAVATWLVNTMRPGRPYPILNLEGEQSTGKSFAAKTLTQLTDPSIVDLRLPPSSHRDLAVSCKNTWLLALDNISSLSRDLSDALCVVSTGGGFATRSLFTDSDEHAIRVRNPLLLTGIAGVATRSDLADRAMTVVLPAITDDARRPEAELEREVERALPGLVGALLDALSAAIRRLSEVSAQSRPLPRMADAALWALAAAPALGILEADLHEAFMASRDEQARGRAQDDVVGGAVLTLLETGPFDGKMSELLDALVATIGIEKARHAGFPRRAAELGKQLRRLAPDLRRAGCQVALHPRWVRLESSEKRSAGSSSSQTGVGEPIPGEYDV